MNDDAREKYHKMLDEAMNMTKEGETFLKHFVQLIVDEALEKNDNNKKKEDDQPYRHLYRNAYGGPYRWKYWDEVG